jgi:hypothetical protein
MRADNWHASWQLACELTTGMRVGNWHASWQLACELATGMRAGNWHASWQLSLSGRDDVIMAMIIPGDTLAPVYVRNVLLLGEKVKSYQ